MPSRVVAIGERDQVRSFRGAGVHTVAVEKPEQAARALMEQVADADVALVLITESMAVEMAGTLQDARRRGTAMVLAIPSHLGSRHTSLLEMKSMIERSIGVDMIGKIEGPIAEQD